jgi:hypothetical protein
MSVKIEQSCSITVSDLQSKPITKFRGYCLTDGDVDHEWDSIGIEMLGNWKTRFGVYRQRLVNADDGGVLITLKCP